MSSQSRLFDNHSPASILCETRAHVCASFCSPAGFVRRKDRSAIEFPDPFPGLQHEMAEVNGIRYALYRVSGF